MWYPDRKEKNIRVEDKKLKGEKIESKLSLGEIKEIKEEFLEKYIETEELEKHIRIISSSQLSRFYSLLEERKFYKDSKYIKDFIDDQLKRAKVLGNDTSLGKAEKFYSYYKDNFLKNDDINDSDKNRIYLTLLKIYFRYILGTIRFDEKLGVKKGEN